MKNVASRLSLLVVLLGTPSALASDQMNPLFGFPHLQPSPFTLPAGRLVYGTGMAYGVADFLQIGTNIVRDISKVYNANLKISLWDHPSFAIALTAGWQHYNYKDIDASNPDLKVSSWQPGGVVAFGLLRELALFTGASFDITKTNLVTSGIETSGYIQGAQLGSDLAWAYNPKSKKGVGNVLAAGVTYDVTYGIIGFGLSHHWHGFQLGIHYYPNATQYRVYPIIAGGGSVDL